MLVDTPSELLDLARREMVDTVAPYLWSDNDLYFYMDLAQREFARETRCIVDGVTFTGIDVEEGNQWVPYDDSIIDIKRAYLSTANRVLTPYTMEDMSRYFIADDYGRKVTAVWETDEGTPSHIITDADENFLRLYPIPVADDTLNLTVWREPMSSIEGSNSAFEIPVKWAHYLTHFIAAKAYTNPDFESFDARKYAEEQMKWTMALTEVKSYMKKKTRRPRGTAYGGL